MKSTLDAEILKEYCAQDTQPTAHLGTSCPFVGSISLPFYIFYTFSAPLCIL